MNLEDIVTSPEISKKLKQLGVKQESIFSYLNFYANDSLYLRGTYDYEEDIDAKRKITARYSAFTASELLEMLPERLIWKDDDGCSGEESYLTIQLYFHPLYESKESKEYYVFYNHKNDLYETFFGGNLAHALAQQLIHLIESGHMDANKLG